MKSSQLFALCNYIIWYSFMTHRGGNSFFCCRWNKHKFSFNNLFFSFFFQVYPGRDITNIVESSHYQKIGGWCRQGTTNTAKCKGAQRWIKPFRCLGEFYDTFSQFLFFSREKRSFFLCYMHKICLPLQILSRKFFLRF